MNFSAVILAGGKSSRMGRDKAWLEVGGRPLLARRIQLAREPGAKEVFVSGRADTGYAALGSCVLWDSFMGTGPLTGIERALIAANSPLLLVLAVDPPEMNVEFLRRLSASCSGNVGAVPRVDENIEPLAAFYPKTVQPLVETLLHDNRNAAATFAESYVQSDLARFVELPAAERRHFVNWNSPADLPCTT